MKMYFHYCKFVLLILCSLTIVGVKAQSFDKEAFLKVPPEDRAVKITELMKTRLLLNEQQVTQVSTVNRQYISAVYGILKSDAGKYTKARQAKAKQEETDLQLKKILTPAQFTTYEKIRDELTEKLRSKRNSIS